MLLLGAVRPHAGETVGLQLDAHLQRDWPRSGSTPPAASASPAAGCRARPGRDGRPRARSHRLRKTCRPCCPSSRRTCAAGRRRTRCRDRCAGRAGNRTAPSPTARMPHGVGSERREQPQLRRVIGPAAGGENFASSGPRCRRAPRRRIRRSASLRRAGVRPAAPGCCCLRPAAAGQNLRAVDQHARIDAEIPADQADDDDGADAEPAGAARHAAARRARFAIVFDIVAAAEIIPTHLSLSFAIRNRTCKLFWWPFTVEKAAIATFAINQVFPGIYCLVRARFRLSRFLPWARHDPVRRL